MLFDIWIQFSELILSIVSLFLMCLIIIAAAMLSQVTARFLHWLQTYDFGQAFYLKRQTLSPKHK